MPPACGAPHAGGDGDALAGGAAHEVGSDSQPANAADADPPLQLEDLPTDCVVAVLLALTPAERCRAAAVSRAWRALVVQPAAWACLDLRGAPFSVDAAQLRALTARAAGALRRLALTTSRALPPAAVVGAALAADAGALAELRVSPPPSPHDSDVEDAEDEEALEAETAALAWGVQHAAALHRVPVLALPLRAEALDAPLASLLTSGRVHDLALERATLFPADVAELVDLVLHHRRAIEPERDASSHEWPQREAACGARAADRVHTPLRVLRLRLNSVGDAGAASLARLTPQLTRLHLGFNDIGDVGATALALALTGSAQTPSTLRELDLRHCAVGAAGAAALARASCCASPPGGAPLTRLVLLHNRIGAEGAAQLAAALRRGCALTHLELGHNGLGRRGVAALARSGLGRLRSLGLAHNSCCAVGARELARALAHNTSLTRLDIGRNALGDEGVRELCVALRGHAALTCLAAPVVAAGPEAARRFGGLLRGCTALTALDVSGNTLGRGVAALAAGLGDGAGAMRTLRLTAVAADDAGACALAKALRAVGGAGLTRLSLRANPIGDDSAHALAAAACAPGARIARLDLRDTFVGATDRGAAELRRAAALRGGRLTLLGVHLAH
jgi:hypothetical protein